MKQNRIMCDNKEIKEVKNYLRRMTAEAKYGRVDIIKNLYELFNGELNKAANINESEKKEYKRLADDILNEGNKKKIGCDLLKMVNRGFNEVNERSATTIDDILISSSESGIEIPNELLEEVKDCTNMHHALMEKRNKISSKIRETYGPIFVYIDTPIKNLGFGL